MLTGRELWRKTKRQTRENDGKTMSESGLALNGTSYCGNLRTARSGRWWLQNLQQCPKGQPDYGIGEVNYD